MIKERINKLRQWLKKNSYDAIVIPTNDPHFSEYVAKHWKVREWVSGFTGSAGTVVITADKALLWCDSRYYVQSAIELDSSLFEVKKIGLAETPSINKWLNTSLKKDSTVVVDGKLFSISAFEQMKTEVTNCKIKAIEDPFVKIWNERPEIPKSIVRILDETITGESIKSKRNRIVETLNIEGNSIYITALLDEIAWLLNIRGADVKFNPVVISYAVVSVKGIKLFVDCAKILDGDTDILNSLGVEVVEYNDFNKYLSNLKNINVILNFSKFDVYHYERLIKAGARIISERGYAGVITSMKAIKNEAELHGMHRAMVSDGVSLVKFNMWLERALDNEDKFTEYDLARKIHEYRMSCPTFVGDSFAPIIGYKSNGAIVHYSPTKEGAANITPDGFLLLDSGGQYEYGTTDITRTLHLSNPTEKEKADYTLVLKGNISLVNAVFPAGTCGFQLDILARQHLLKNGLNYLHGTGHGVGHYLNVHEGPQSVRMDYNPTPIVPGMVLSNEPGVYREGEYGIRLENIIECVKHSTTEFGEFYKFQTITLFPFDLKCIDVGMLTIEERHWLNRYHSKVFDKLSQFLDTDERFWLSNKTKAI